MKRNYQAYKETIQSLKDLKVEEANLQQKLREFEAEEHFLGSEKKVKKNEIKPSAQTNLKAFFKAISDPKNESSGEMMTQPSSTSSSQN